MDNTGERITRVETEMINIKDGMLNLKDDISNFKEIAMNKMNDIHIALLGDGKQNLGLSSRVKTLEDNEINNTNMSNFKEKLYYCIIGLLGTLTTILGTYLSFF